ncbi:AraC family transcriptional regulator [Paenibacillus oceani]|uniref:Helix-turn-helix transcriptional regulator n=1 Tax=Paenibacillus oceani TaxID=2772510 RepID=A0A927CC39_9BACL|nr:AraC family transcriptional regulator [Paenibacillus oceani]MBD2865319.1 helix-turn-helix transcriptional regulator [Paenibacillus oceani]
MKARSAMFSFTRYSYRQDSCNESPVIHAHPQYEIGYIHSGSFSYMMGGRKIDIESGDLILLSGLTIHGVHARVHDMIGSKFVFDAQLAQIFSSSLLSYSPLEPFKTVNNARIRLGAEDREEFERILAQIDRFHRLHRQDQTQFNRMLVAFFDLLLFIGAQCGVAELERSSPSKEKERLVREVIEFIERHFADDLRLENMEAEFYTSKYHLSRIFREVTGLSIFEYLCHKRIEQAKWLLHEHACEHAVSDICYRVGYNHPAHFSRVFKKLVGMSPNQYRKMKQ